LTIAYFDGEFGPLEDIRISPLDRGFMFGDGVYEVIPVYAGRMFRADAHLERLERSLAAIRIEDAMGRNRWSALLEELVERNGGGHQAVYLQVTRGAAPRDHAFPGSVAPTVFAMTRLIDVDSDRPPLRAITRPDIRWTRCDIKSVALLPNVLMRQEAQDAGASEAIMIRDGLLTEGTSSNVFVVLGDSVYTPPKSTHILGGVTRDLLLELAAAAGVDCREEPVTEAQLRIAREIWVTSSTREVVAVTRLDGEPVGEGVPGPLWKRVHDLYQDFKARLIRGDVA
jgi:D-alanine transaminase